MKSLTIRHTRITETSEAAYLMKFIHHLSNNSPLEELYLIADSSEIRGPCVSFAGLVEHLITRHADTLRVLHMSTVFLSMGMVRNLCIKCPRMEELAIACHDHILVHCLRNSGKSSSDLSWQDIATISRLVLPLRRLSLVLPHSKARNGKLSSSVISQILANGQGNLRHFQINHVQWKVGLLLLVRFGESVKQTFCCRVSGLPRERERSSLWFSKYPSSGHHGSRNMTEIKHDSPRTTYKYNTIFCLYELSVIPWASLWCFSRILHLFPG